MAMIGLLQKSVCSVICTYPEECGKTVFHAPSIKSSMNNAAIIVARVYKRWTSSSAGCQDSQAENCTAKAN